jgi:O-antigen/teichoic acid export membrane protein
LNKIKSLAGQTAIYGLSSIIGRIFNYLLTPLYTYKFNPEQYGVYTEMYAYSAFLLVLLTYGMETAFFRFAKSEGENRVFGTTLISVLSTGILFSVIGIAFAPVVSDWLNGGQDISIPYTTYIRWFVIIIVLDAVSSIPFAKLRQDNKPKKFALVKLLNIGLNIGLNLFFILGCPYILSQGENHLFYSFIDSFYNPNIGIGYAFIANLTASVITFLVLMPEMLKNKLSFDYLLWKKLIRYASPLIIVGLAGIINENADRILLKEFLPFDTETKLQMIGIYGACYKISILMTIFIQAFRYAAEPFFFSQKDAKDAKETYAEVFKFFIIACSIIYMGVMLNLSWLSYFVGPEYRIGISIVPILLLANLFLGAYYNLSVWYKVTDNTRFGAYIGLFGALLTIALNILLIPVFGYIGSAWATLACYISMFGLSYLIGKKYYPINYPVKRSFLYLSTAVSVSLLTYFNIEDSSLFIITIKNTFLILFIAIVYYVEFYKNRMLKTS